MLLSQNDNFADTSFLQKGAVWPVGYECARGEKKANLRRFLGNLKVHLKTKSAPMTSFGHSTKGKIGIR